MRVKVKVKEGKGGREEKCQNLTLTTIVAVGTALRCRPLLDVGDDVPIMEDHHGSFPDGLVPDVLLLSLSSCKKTDLEDKVPIRLKKNASQSQFAWRLINVWKFARGIHLLALLKPSAKLLNPSFQAIHNHLNSAFGFFPMERVGDPSDIIDGRANQELRCFHPT